VVADGITNIPVFTIYDYVEKKGTDLQPEVADLSQNARMF
jgi:hypothetical protein